MGTIYVVYSSATDASSAVTNTTYATARSSTAVTTTGSQRGTAQNSFLTPDYVIGQSFLIFDTSAVPAGGVSGYFSLDNSNNPAAGNTNSDAIRFREVSSTANKIAGASLAALTLHSDLGTVPTALGRFTSNVVSAPAIPRSATFRIVVHTANEQAGTTPTGINRTSPYLGNQTGTTNDPFISITTSDWAFVGVGNVVEVTGTAHALVTTGISGTLQAGDLLIACISSRIASTTSITLPTGGEWTRVSEQKTNNTLTTTSAAASGMMAYCVRGASNPNLTFTHPVAPSVALGRIVAYRNVNGASPDTQTSFTTASTTAVSGTGLTTTQIEDLIVAMAAGGQEAAWSAFNATDPAGASGATVTTAPTSTWSERADSLTTTGADTSLAIFDAVKLTSGATGNLTATADMAALHVVIAGAFKIAVAAATGTGTPASQSAAVGTTGGISASAGSGTPAAQASAVGGLGTVSSAGVSGTGALAADIAAVSAAGVSASTGTGVLAAQAATTAGVGVSASSGTGALAAQAATASGAGAVASIGTGALAAQAAAVAGTGSSVSAGTGALQAAAAAVAGAGASASTGTGSVAAGSAAIAGTGTAAAANSGALVAQAAAVAGTGSSVSAGTGAVQADAATVAGAGLGVSTGIGALVASPATVVGEGVVLDAGSIIGTGALLAGAATIAGEGEVTGEVAPPIFVGGGIYRPSRPRPFSVEGVGYGILPQLEGEAFGLVVAVGAGVATIPRLAGTAVGTVGVAGRSLARLAAIKVAAVGDRGQAGAAVAVLRAATASGSGVAVARGSGSGVVLGIKGAAIGRHDDDEAAIMALLLAA